MTYVRRHESDEFFAGTDSDVGSNTNQHGIRCPWPNCKCTHRGCAAGWIDRIEDDETGRGREVATPCPTCRTDLYDHLSGGGRLDAWRSKHTKGGGT